MSRVNLYSVFHLNIAFSSITERDRGTVISHCYWPLLKLAEKFPGAIAIEASGYTLEVINELDKDWLKKFNELLQEKKCEFIGSGYAQIIGPLVPYEVNLKNLKIGNEVYLSLIGFEPKIVYVNEQSYSAGMIDNYLSAGCEAIIMEWNNAASSHPSWIREWQYQPQRVVNQYNQVIRILWNNSFAFQRFQRYVHGEIDLEDYSRYLKYHEGSGPRFFSLYGSDAEVFNFRPQRHSTETSLKTEENEWITIEKLLKSLTKDGSISLVLPSDVLKVSGSNKASQILKLETAEKPILVKKQEKYNISRWALTGKYDLEINTKCYRIFENIKNYSKQEGVLGINAKARLDLLWKELCFLWSSDFRTHIEEGRLKLFLKRLNKTVVMSERLVHSKKYLPLASSVKEKSDVLKQKGKHPVFQKIGKNIIVSTSTVLLSLNQNRGFAIDRLVFKNISDDSLIGTLPQGHYENILLGVDFYSGHTVIEIPGERKVTDLEKVNDFEQRSDDTDFVSIRAVIKTRSGIITKVIKVFKNINRIDIAYSFDLKNAFPATIRSGIMTINPKAFDLKSLYYGCQNGGKDEECFPLKDAHSINHQALSLSVSSSGALGNTDGCFRIGDKSKTLQFKTDMAQTAVLPMLHFKSGSMIDPFFLRILYSLQEFDETSLLRLDKKRKLNFSLTIIGSNTKDD